MANKSTKNSEIVIRLDKVTLISAGLMILLAIVIIIGLFAYLTPKPGTTSRPTSPAQAVQPMNAPLLLPTAVMPQDTPFPTRNLVPAETVEVMYTESARWRDVMGTSIAKPAPTLFPYMATAEAESPGSAASGQAYRDQVDKEYAEAMRTGKCVPAESLGKPEGGLYTCPNALFLGRPDFSCGLCQDGVEGCPHPGKYYYCLNSQVEIKVD